MGRSLMLVLVAALAVGVFAPAAFAQDDNPTGDDLGGDDSNGGYEGVYIYDDNPTGDAVVATPKATTTPMSSATSTPSATPTATSTPTASATPSATVTSGGVSASPRAGASALPRSGGVPVLSVALGLLLVGAGIVTAMLLRRTS
jgi:cytoskeletal protein RodZ